jgi:hypothetical protein
MTASPYRKPSNNLPPIEPTEGSAQFRLGVLQVAAPMGQNDLLRTPRQHACQADTRFGFVKGQAPIQRRLAVGIHYGPS